MARRKDNAQCLTITARIAHKFAIESSNEILARASILNVVKDILLQELSVEFQWGFAQFGINFVQTGACADDRKFTHQLVTFCIRPNIGCFEATLNSIVNQLAVSGCFVTEQIIGFEELVIQCQKNTGDHQRLVLILQGAIGAQILVQFRRIFQNFLRSLFNIGLFCQNVTSIVFVDIDSGEGGKRFNIRELLIAISIIHIQWSDSMMLFIARNADCKNLMEAAILCNVLGVKICPINSVICNIFLIDRQDSRTGQLLVLGKISFILNDDNKVFYNCNILRISGIASTSL